MERQLDLEWVILILSIRWSKKKSEEEFFGTSIIKSLKNSKCKRVVIGNSRKDKEKLKFSEIDTFLLAKIERRNATGNG